MIVYFPAKWIESKLAQSTQQFAYSREARDIWLLFTIVGLLEMIGLALI